MMSPPEVLQTAAPRTIAPRTHTYTAWVQQITFPEVTKSPPLSPTCLADFSPPHFLTPLPVTSQWIGCSLSLPSLFGMISLVIVCTNEDTKKKNQYIHHFKTSNIWKPHSVLLTCHPQRPWWKRDVAAWQFKLVRRTFTYAPTLPPSCVVETDVWWLTNQLLASLYRELYVDRFN